MSWMNTWEIDQAVETHRGHPVLGPATRMLAEYRDTVNRNSDGWAYWSAATNAAGKLMELVQIGNTDYGRGAAKVTKEQFKKAQTPLKAFCTRKNLPFPQLADDPGTDLNNVLQRLSELHQLASESLQAVHSAKIQAELRLVGWSGRLKERLESLEHSLEQTAATSRQLRMEIADAKLEPAK